MPPARLTREVSDRYLSLLERKRIAALRRMGLGVRAIARELGRSPSTLSRELKRNTHRLRALAQAKLEVEWSPGQIAGWLRVTYPERTGWHLYHETIYQALYHAHRTGLARELTRRLRTGDWEGDLIMGSGARTAVVSLVERRSRHLHLVALPEGHGADAVARAPTPILAKIPAAWRRTLTWDQGGEMARHHHIARYLTDGVFFTEPGSPGRNRPWKTSTG